MRASNIGFVRKIETLGTLDGPGIRTVVFLSGCPLRCLYCHNPDMWKTEDRDKVDVETIMKRLIRMKPYYGADGGVTFCGGEPLGQPEFLLTLLKRCKEEGIHTCLDTSGCGVESSFDEILSYTDLILLDIKGLDAAMQQKLTGKSYSQQAFIEIAERKNVPFWIRMVVIPGYNDSLDHMNQLIEIVQKLKGVEKVELLPYHTLGLKKYESMNMEYPLKDVKAMDLKSVQTLQEYVNKKLGTV